MDAPNEFQPLMDDIFREKVRRARAEKVSGELSLAGFDLFDLSLAWSREGVKAEHPSASEAEIEAALQRRLAIQRRLDERDIYRPAA